MSHAALLTLAAAMGVRLPRSLRGPPDPKPLDAEADERIAAAEAKRERRRQKRLAKESP